MAQRRYIGESAADAVTWVQDLLGVPRPIAEACLLSAYHDGTAEYTFDGVFLAEDEEETRQRAQRTHQSSYRIRSRHVTSKTKAARRHVLRNMRISNWRKPDEDDDVPEDG